MTIDQLKEYKFNDIFPIIMELSDKINDPEVVVMNNKFRQIIGTPFYQELFYEWAIMLINKYNVEFIQEIRKRKLKNINDAL